MTGIRLHHYTVEIEGLRVHFIHEKSKDRRNAIPLLINHGWPGSSFLEFEPVINELTKVANISGAGRRVSFDVVVPSLPGFAFSSPAPANWTLDDTARIYNTLMTDVLGYPKYAVHGTAHGAAIAYTLYEDYNATTRAAHFTFIPFFPPTAEEVAKMNVSLTPLEEFMLQRSDEWAQTGNAYYLLQLTTVTHSFRALKPPLFCSRLISPPTNYHRAQHHRPCSARQSRWPTSLDRRKVHRL